MHDSCHASVTHNPSLWKHVGSTFDIVTGCSFFAWMHQHVIGHHIYTNVYGADPDLGEVGVVDFRRITSTQKWLWFYKYQYIYAPFLYGLLSIKYRLQDWQTFFMRKNGAIRVLNPDPYYFKVFFSGKFFWFTMRLAVPTLFFDVPFSRVLIMFFASELACGYYLAFVFQVSHVATNLEFIEVSPTVNSDWAIMQVATTQDYGHGNTLATYLSGSLNYQVVHHLFPTVCQDYYPEIAPLIQQTCDEFGVKYHVLPTGFLGAFKTHIDYLKIMGEPTNLKKQA